MPEFQASIEQLITLLENLRQPWELDSHPWAASLLIRDQPGASPGEKLVNSICKIFRGMLPAQPPRRGKRLDTRWGAFGFLAAQYFAPLEFGLPAPQSQREAWLGIDQAILLYVFGAQAEISAEQRANYNLVGNELEIAPNSTLSGWKRKGLEIFLALVLQKVEKLEAGLRGGQQPGPVPSKTLIWKSLSLAFSLLLIGFALWAGWQGYQLSRQVRLVIQDVLALQPYLTFLSNPQVQQIAQAASQVSILRADLNKLQTQAAPFLWLAPSLGWLPRYGGDLSHAPQLLDLALSLSVAADEGLQTLLPVAGTVLQQDQPLDVMAVLNQLQQDQPRLLAAQLALAQAQAARQQINDDLLSDQMRALLQQQVDPLIQTVQGKFKMEDALLLVKAAPSLLGVGKAGPKTYLLLIQNEDELRPTGGFITAVGSVVLKDGGIWDIKVEASDLVDDFSKPYPRAPWQLNEFMRLPFLAFRDSNWFTDFPTTATMAEYLYSYARAHSVDGVIAFNQNVVVELLKTLGPIRTQGMTSDISADNVLGYMRTAKQQQAPPGFIGLWDRKQFIGRLAEPLLEKILAARGDSLSALSQTLITLMDQRFILLQFDDPDLTAFLARRKWDGALRPPMDSDYLMVVDSNVGYTKTSAVTEMSLTYQVDLADLTQPLTRLAVSQTNKAIGTVPCVVFPPREDVYPLYDCYWSYLRVYTSSGVQLFGASPHAVPAAATMSEVDIPARVDDLGNEDIPGLQVFGTLVLIPQQQTVQTGFDLGLPVSVLQQAPGGQWLYRLTVQKQAGTKAVPLELRLILPPTATILSGPPGLTSEQGSWRYDTTLTEDVVIEISFSVE